MDELEGVSPASRFSPASTAMVEYRAFKPSVARELALTWIIVHHACNRQVSICIFAYGVLVLTYLLIVCSGL